MASAKPKPLDQYQSILSEAKSGNTKPIYLLSGEETYLIDELVTGLSENVLDPEAQEYGLFTYYGKDTSAPDLISACHQTSFFSPKIMVVLKEAQDLRDFKSLDSYFETPNPSCTLVIAYKNKKVDSRTKAYKAAAKSGVVFDSRRLYDNEVRSWLKTYTEQSKLKIQPPEIELLITYLGSDLSKLANEIEKLRLNLEEGATIKGEDIEKYTGISKEYNVYAISKAITQRNSKELYRMLRHFGSNTKSAPLMVVLATLTRFYVQMLQYHSLKGKSDREIAGVLKINPYFVRDYHDAARSIDGNKAKMSLALLYDYNKKAVGIDSAASEQDLLTELLIRLFHA